MARVHLLRVGNGDCTIIEHDSGNVSMIDICGGNPPLPSSALSTLAAALEARTNPRPLSGLFSSPPKSPPFSLPTPRLTDPIEYLASLGHGSIFRFILTHPEMDHLDGFDRLARSTYVTNFWDPGVRRKKPDFADFRYKEADWDRYVHMRDGSEATRVVHVLAGNRFPYANQDALREGIGDGLFIASPDRTLVDEANGSQQFNDASYIVSFWSTAGPIVLPGDAHDKAWDYAMRTHRWCIEDCRFLVAPHHGRQSNRSFDFLKVTNPSLSLLGHAPSKHLAYDAWYRRDLETFTQRQAGNVVLEILRGVIDVFVQDKSFAERMPGGAATKNSQGYHYAGRIS